MTVKKRRRRKGSKQDQNGWVKERMRAWRKWVCEQYTEEEVTNIGIEMFNYMLEHDHQHLDHFCVEHKISLPQLKAWADHFTIFRNLFDLTKQIIAARVKDGWRSGNIDRVYARHCLEVWDPDIRELVMEKFKSGSRVELSKASRKVFEVIEMPKFTTDEKSEKNNSAHA